MTPTGKNTVTGYSSDPNKH